MKTAHVLLILVLAALATACSTVKNRSTDVTGEWEWIVPGSAYFGKMELKQASDGTITGRMFDTSGGNGGKLNGTFKQNYLQFTRTWGSHEQRYHLALSPDGKELSGMFEGSRDQTIGTDFEAKRK